ncbi:MAG TPA: acriflavin resistance protein, partial [Paracoccaceae bacterium]
MTAPSPAAARRRLPLNWIGIVPFVVFALLFLILPTMNIVLGAFRNAAGEATFANIRGLFTPSILASYWISIKISVASSLLGCAIGFGMAAAVVLGGLPRWIRSPVLTFSGVASNFAGVPLAFAFMATIGPRGLLTLWLLDQFGINLRVQGFTILSFWGLTIT